MTLKNIVSLKYLISEDNQIEDMFEDAKRGNQKPSKKDRQCKDQRGNQKPLIKGGHAVQGPKG